jgi:hypothetical protein
MCNESDSLTGRVMKSPTPHPKRWSVDHQGEQAGVRAQDHRRDDRGPLAGLVE